jgi:hypothetical protein
MRFAWTQLVATALVACTPSSPAAPHDAGPSHALDAGKIADAGDSGARPAATVARDAGLPEDTAMPAASSEELTTRMRHLVEAIAQDNPELAADVILPRDAYLAAYDANDPGKAWDRKVGSTFRKHVHAVHKRHKGAEKATFVSFEIGRAITQVSPKKGDLKRPLWRVKRSRLTVSIDGKEHKIEIAEMISWRGAWYVAKLR